MKNFESNHILPCIITFTLNHTLRELNDAMLHNPAHHSENIYYPHSSVPLDQDGNYTRKMDNGQWMMRQTHVRRH